MDARIELRKKDFKKTFDNPRRRREEQQVQIRKQNREARLSKKRQAALEDLPETNVTEMDGGVTLSVEDIPRMALQVMSDDGAQQLEGAQNFRKLLSIAKNPPIKEVIQSGVTPRLVELLQDDSRPDVQFQAAWALTNIASGTQEQTQVVVKHGAVPIFVRLLSSNKWDVREQAIWALGNIAGDCHTCRDLVFQEGALEPLLHQLKICLNYKQHGAASNEVYDQIKPTMLTNATWTLSNLCRGKPRCQLQWIAPALPILKELIYLNDTEVLADACWALSYLSEGNDEQSSNAIGMILGAGVASRLVQLLQHSSQNVQTPALRAVGNIVSGNDQQTETMIVSGCISALKALLTRAKKTLVRKETCWTISNITAGNRSQIQAVIDEGLIPLLVEMHPHADSEVKKEIGWALANAASGASAIQVQYLVEVKVIPPLCKSLNVGDDSSLVGAALEALLNILSVGKQLQQEINSSENPYAVLVEEANAYPLLEQLQYAPVNSKEYILAMKIMTTYLSFEEDDDEQNHTNAESYEQFGQGTTDATIRNNQSTPTEILGQTKSDPSIIVNPQTFGAALLKSKRKMTDATSLPQNEQHELLCTYASLILFDEKITVSAENITKLIQASGATVEPYLPMLFSRALGQCNIKDLLMSAGSTSASNNSSVPSSDAVSNDKVTEEVKEEEKEEEEEDMGFSLFD